MMKEMGADAPQNPAGSGYNQIPHVDEDGGPLEALEPRSYAYDEWDFRANDYRPRWCIVQERVAVSGETAFYNETIHAYSGLLEQIRRQFESVRPEMYRKVKRLPEGEDIDLDAGIEALIDIRNQMTPDERIYWRRQQGRARRRRRLPPRYERLHRRGRRGERERRRRGRPRRPGRLHRLAPRPPRRNRPPTLQAHHRRRERVNGSPDDRARKPSATATASTASPASDAKTSSSTSSKRSKELFTDRVKAPPRQNRSAPRDADGPRHSPRRHETGERRRQDEVYVRNQRRPPAGQGLLARGRREGVRRSGHAHGADGGAPKRHHAFLPHRRPATATTTSAR